MKYLQDKIAWNTRKKLKDQEEKATVILGAKTPSASLQQFKVNAVHC
jgi:hypothetical protein